MSDGAWRFFRYRDKNGDDPVREFLEEQITHGEQGQILARMQMVHAMVKGHIVENLGGGLYALRAPNTPNNPRVFMCPHPKVRGSYVMLHAYRKKGDKIPESEKATARKRQNEVNEQPNKQTHHRGMAMKKAQWTDTFDELMEIVESKPEALTEYKVELLRIELALALREARECIGITQREMAKTLGVRQPWVSKLESCNNDHTLESLAKYIFALGADITLSMDLDDDTSVKLVSSKQKPKAVKYKAGSLPVFIKFLDESAIDSAYARDWGQIIAGLGNQSQLGFVDHVA